MGVRHGGIGWEAGCGGGKFCVVATWIGVGNGEARAAGARSECGYDGWVAGCEQVGIVWVGGGVCVGRGGGVGGWDGGVLGHIYGLVE